MPGAAFPGDEEPVTLEGDPEDALKVLLEKETAPGADDVVEPVLDD